MKIQWSTQDAPLSHSGRINGWASKNHLCQSNVHVILEQATTSFSVLRRLSGDQTGSYLEVAPFPELLLALPCLLCGFA